MRKDRPGGHGTYPMRSNKNGLYPDYEELKRDAPGAGIRKFFLVVYFLVAAILATSLILLVNYGNFSNVIN